MRHCFAKRMPLIVLLNADAAASGLAPYVLNDYVLSSESGQVASRDGSVAFPDRRRDG
jgi:hypothetical protein